MTFPEQWYLYPILGVLAGTISGSLGVGAGILVVPALVHLAYSQKEAQGIALCLMVPMALFGAIRYHLNPNIHISYPVVGLLAVASLLGVYFGTSIAAVADNQMLRKSFSLLLFAVSLKMWFTA